MPTKWKSMPKSNYEKTPCQIKVCKNLHGNWKIAKKLCIQRVNIISFTVCKTNSQVCQKPEFISLKVLEKCRDHHNITYEKINAETYNFIFYFKIEV